MSDVDVTHTLTTLAALTAALSKASAKLLGKSSNSIMYLSGSDMGKEEGRKLDRSSDPARALQIAAGAQLRGWTMELWQDADQKQLVWHDGGYDWAWLVFRECPVRQMCLAYDVELGDSLCQLSHGYLAGVLSLIMERKVDLLLDHAGVNACKKRLRMK